MPTTSANCYRILSIDGGGVRGLIPAIWLEELERRLGAPLHEHFDLIVGTSTGSILACSVASGRPASEAVAFYQRYSQEVFPPLIRDNFVSRVAAKITHLFRPKHSADGLARVLTQVFATNLLGDLKVPTMVTTFNLLNRRALMLKSWQVKHAPLKVADVCHASSAAPTFLPSHDVDIGHATLPLIDGGVVAGSPSSVALTEAVRLNRVAGRHQSLDQYVVVSLGTGVTADSITAEQGRTWGLRNWAAPLFDIVLDGNRQVADYHCRHLLAPGRYFRLQTRLAGLAEAFDDASAENLNAAAALAEHWLQRPESRAQLDELVGLLQACSTATP